MFEKISIEESRGLWVFIEQNNGHAAPVSLELLGKGRTLAEKLGVEVTAILIGEHMETLAKGLSSYGATRLSLQTIQSQKFIEPKSTPTLSPASS